MKTPRNKGFSLLELAFTAGLLGMSIGLFILSGGSNLKTKPGVEALAQALANELGQARLLAVRQQSPVAVMFPCDNRPHSTSVYQLEGLTNPHVSRSQNYAGDFPKICFFLGTWTGTESRDPLVTGTKWSNFPLDEWIPTARQGDYAIVFMPDGTVRSNDLPQFDREYHVAVCAGVANYNATNPSGGIFPSDKRPGLYKALGLGEAKTVCINAGGGIHVENGLVGTTSVAAHGSMQGPDAPSAPRKVTYLGEAEGNPKGTSSLPAPQDGEPTTIPPDGFVTLTTFAQDSAKSGQRLFCSWKVIPTQTASTQLGAYSIPVDDTKGAAMDFNPRSELGSAGTAPAYESSWQWRPPDDAKPGDIFTMSLLLQNEEKQLVEVDIKKKLMVLPYGSILFEYQAGPNRNLYRMNADGTGRKRFHIFPSKPSKPSLYNDFSPTTSANGERIAFLSDNRPGVIGGAQDIFITDRNGDSVSRITVNEFCEAPGLSPPGDRIAYKRWNAGANSYDLCVSSVAGGPATVLRGAITGVRNSSAVNDKHVHFAEDRVAWLPDNRILYTDASGVTLQIASVQANAQGDFVSNDPSQPAHGSFGSWSPYWSPRSGHIYYTRDDGASYGDPLVGQDGVVYSLSEFWNETQANAIQYGAEERLLTVRTPAPTNPSPPGPNRQIYLIRPVLGANPAEVRQLTHEAGESRCPIYLP